MKHRYLVIAMILVMSLAVIGCGKKAEPAPSAPTAPAEQPTPAAPTPEAQAAAEAEARAAEQAAAEAAETIVEIPETEMGPGIVSEESIQSGDYVQHSLLGAPQNSDAAHARDLTDTPERFSNFDCQFDAETGIRYISVKVTNTNADHPFMISPMGVAKGYNTYFMIRGMVDKDPGCAVEELAPGESTVCTKIGMDDQRFGNPAGTNRLTIQSPDNNGKYISEAVIVNCPSE